MSHSISLRLLRAGWCRHLECMAARGGRLVPVNFPALCALIHHPIHGWMLFDTGYASHFFDATRQWPERLYRSLLPVQLPVTESLPAQLAVSGIQTTDIRHVIISHFHGDHIAGLRDYPQANLIALRADSNALHMLKGQRWRATCHGTLPGLLPDDFFARLCYADTRPYCSLPVWMAPFKQGLDLFGDGSLIGIPLPGHSHGQLGLFIPDADGRPVFLVADACWSLPACQEGRLPSPLLRFTSADWTHYRRTFFNVQTLSLREPDLAILPSHCEQAWQLFCTGKRIGAFL